MRQIVLSMLNAPVLVAVGLAAVGVQTSLFAWAPLGGAQPDALLILVIWFAIQRSFMEGGILTLLMGEIAEVHSAAPQGLTMVVYMLAYLAVRGSSRFLAFDGRISRSALAAFWGAAARAIAIVIAGFLRDSPIAWQWRIPVIAAGAVANGALGFFAFPWLERLDWITFKNPRARQALGDEPFLESYSESYLEESYRPGAGGER